jgi:hypothetical protein
MAAQRATHRRALLCCFPMTERPNCFLVLSGHRSVLQPPSSCRQTPGRCKLPAEVASTAMPAWPSISSREQQPVYRVAVNPQPRQQPVCKVTVNPWPRQRPVCRVKPGREGLGGRLTAIKKTATATQMPNSDDKGAIEPMPIVISCCPAMPNGHVKVCRESLTRRSWG